MGLLKVCSSPIVEMNRNHPNENKQAIYSERAATQQGIQPSSLWFGKDSEAGRGKGALQ